ncbi:NAD(P)H-binding protein [Mucilaginibacter sp.]
MEYKAIIAGASGLIGSSLLTILLNEPSYAEITVLVRKKTGITHPKLTEILVDFDKLDDYTGDINGHALFCCIGTTKNKTPDLTDYFKIEHDYPVTLGQLADKNGVKQYHYVSSIGADKNSSAYYTKFKGQTEYNLQQLHLATLHIYRPSILSGDRKDHRPMEKFVNGLMYLINPLLIGSLKKYRSIPAKTVAMAMYKQSINSDEGIFIHASDQIKQIA